MRSFRSVLTLLSLIAMCTASMASVRESKEWLIDTRAHRFLTSVADNLGFPDTPIANGNAVVALSISGCNFTVTAVGPIQSSAKKYAETIDSWLRSQGF